MRPCARAKSRGDEKRLWAGHPLMRVWKAEIRRESSMRITFLMTAAVLFVSQAGPLAAQPRYDTDARGTRWPHRSAVDETGQNLGRPEAFRRKPRVCYRPDVGRYSRLIPYSC